MLTEMSVYGKGYIEDPKKVQELIDEIKKEPEKCYLYFCDDILILKFEDEIYVITKFLTRSENVDFS